MPFVDIHSHLLPGVDDGAKDMEQSVRMARLAVEDGIRLSLVTPHHLNGVYSNPASEIRRHLNGLREALLAEGIDLKLLPGAELHLVPELPDELARGTAMTVAGLGKAALVELPVHTVPHGVGTVLEQIMSQGITPIVAHPERNSELRQNPEILSDWVEMGCLAQVTGMACTGKFGPQVQESAREMVQGGLIHYMASDAHRDSRRIPRMSDGRDQIARWTNDEVATLLTETNPAALVIGEEPDLDRLYSALEPDRKSSGWRRWLGWRSAPAP